MSSNSMPIHKFGRKPAPPRDPPNVSYRPHENLLYPARARIGRYEVFVQEQFTIQPRAMATVMLKFGITIRPGGMVFTSLRNDLIF